VKGGTNPIAAAFVAACRDELEAPKAGNVHLFAGGHRMTAVEFLRSADAAAGPLCTAGARVGQRILDAVDATFNAVGMNTNLGIILLCAPLAAAAELKRPDLRTALAEVIDALDTEDASLAFRAIVRASPGGLGHAERHDVFSSATATLKQAMAEAAHRDRIACQYVTGFADIFDLGKRSLDDGLARWAERKWTTLAVYLGFLAAFPDSHVVRKYGTSAADDVRRTAAGIHEELQKATDPSALLSKILDWDTDLKARRINPGTSADLTVATLFTDHLQSILPSKRNSD